MPIHCEVVNPSHVTALFGPVNPSDRKPPPDRLHRRRRGVHQYEVDARSAVLARGPGVEHKVGEDTDIPGVRALPEPELRYNRA